MHGFEDLAWVLSKKAFNPIITSTIFFINVGYGDNVTHEERISSLHFIIISSYGTPDS
jgi:hypothetical protein